MIFKNILISFQGGRPFFEMPHKTTIGGIACICATFFLGWLTTVTPQQQSINSNISLSQSLSSDDVEENFSVSQHASRTPDVVHLQEGQTLTQMLVNYGVSNADAHAMTQALARILNLRRMPAGQEIYFTWHMPNEGTSAILTHFQLHNDAGFTFDVTRLPNGTFSAHKKAQTFHIKHHRIKGVIRNNLYADGLAAGISPNILYTMFRGLSFDINFQTDVQPGTKFDVIYTQNYNMHTGKKHPGKFLHAALYLPNKRIVKIYAFNPQNSARLSHHMALYNADGQLVNKTIMRTPVDGARLSSGFGMRRHPILGFSRHHKGIDFAAPKGTPVFAAGSGIIEKASFFGAYGNYIRIRHGASGYQTAYAHLSGFAHGMRSGKYVNQGDIIGYIGSTGRSTGPHLHFELIRHGMHINPQLAHRFSTGGLTGSELKRFRQHVTKLERISQCEQISA